jgi:hypothetical protein
VVGGGACGETWGLNNFVCVCTRARTSRAHFCGHSLKLMREHQGSSDSNKQQLPFACGAASCQVVNDILLTSLRISSPSYHRPTGCRVMFSRLLHATPIVHASIRSIHMFTCDRLTVQYESFLIDVSKNTRST